MIRALSHHLWLVNSSNSSDLSNLSFVWSL